MTIAPAPRGEASNSTDSRVSNQRPDAGGATDFGTGQRIGYARVSTDEQTPALQLDALRAAGCARVFVDHASGVLTRRPELDRALDYLRAGDALVVWRFDRLFRSLKELIAISQDLEARGIALVSLREQVDTSTPVGRFYFHMIGAIAEFERDLIRERTMAGLAAARARGRKGGRPSVMTPEKLAVVRQMYEAKQHTVGVIAATVGVSRTALYRALKLREEGKRSAG